MSKYPVYSVPTKVVFKNNGIPVKNKFEITKSTEREVEFETVIYTGYEYSILLEENKPLNVEFFEVGNKEIKIIEDYGWL
jgi:CRISPR-associated protein Cas5t